MELTHDERLLVQLTSSEIQKKGEQLAAKVRKLGLTRAEKKGVAKNYADRITDLEAEIHTLSEEVETGKGYALVAVREIPDLSRGVVATIRTDTGEQIRTRPLSQAEKDELEQARLFAEGEAS